MINYQDHMGYEHPYKVGTIDLIFEMGWLSYAHEDSTAVEDYINLDVASDNVWISFEKPESSVYVRWVGDTSPDNIKALAIKLWDNYQENLNKESQAISIAIFEDANGKRHALLAELYKDFKKSCFWFSTYKHITYTERTDLDQRQINSLKNASAKVVKFGMFDLVGNGWTLQGDVALTEKQAFNRKKAEKAEMAQLKSWERSMKRMDMLPSAANTILGAISNH